MSAARAQAAPAVATPQRHWLAQLAIIVFFGFPLMVLVLGAMALPAVVSYDLVTRGLAESHPGWLVMGALTGAVWLLLVAWTVRRRRNRTAPA